MGEFATTSERVKVPHDPLYVDYIDRDRYIEELAIPDQQDFDYDNV